MWLLLEKVLSFKGQPAFSITFYKVNKNVLAHLGKSRRPHTPMRASTWHSGKAASRDTGSKVAFRQSCGVFPRFVLIYYRKADGPWPVWLRG